jgi:excinuclease ABC subunit B
LVHESKTNVQRRKKAAVPGNRHPERSEGSSEALSKLADLERQMKEAAARLDFEEAARIRDMIRSMDG